MSTNNPSAHSLPLSPRRLAKDLARRFRLGREARVLDVGGGPAIVAEFRARGVLAFGIFDGSAPPRDPYAVAATLEKMPETQPAALHQSLPFPAHTFDCVVLHDSQTYRSSLTGPEACTATANLLATLKPGRPLVWCGSGDVVAIEQHLAAFPGVARRVTLGTGGLVGLVRRLLGQKGQAAIQFNISGQPISRLEWHRLSRQAVMRSQCHPAA